MARYAVIDVGTNSIKCHIAEKTPDGKWREVLDLTEISRLGEGLQKTERINRESMERNVRVITDMMEIIHKHGVEDVVAVGTMCLRTAKNATEFIQRVQQTSGIMIEVIPGQEEAQLAYLAVKTGIQSEKGNILIFDSGGGSTEFIFGSNEHIETRFSLNIGAVLYTEQFLISDPVTEEEIEHVISSVKHNLRELHFQKNIDVLVGIGGTVTNLCAVKHQLTQYTPATIQGSILERREIERQIALYQSKTLEERKHIVGLQPKRADVILAGAIIVHEIMKKTGVDAFTVSARGLRHAVITDRFEY